MVTPLVNRSVDNVLLKVSTFTR